MNLIYLIYQDFKILFRKRKKILCVILTNFLICFIAFFYFFSFYYTSYVRGKNSSQEYKPYRIIYNKSGEQDINVIKLIVDELLVSNKIPEIAKLELHGLGMDNDGNSHNIVGLAMEVKRYRKHFEIRQGQFYKDYDLESNSQLAFIIKSSFTSRYDLIEVGQDIELNNKIYRIIGTGRGYLDEIIYIPYKDFIENHSRVNELSINFKEKLNPSQQDYLMTLVKQIEGYNEIIIPKVNNSDFQELAFKLIIGGGIVLISLLSIINIFRYLTEINLDKFAIHLLCGMSFQKRFLLLLFDIILMLGIIYVLAIIIYESYIESNSLSLFQYVSGFIIIIIFVSINVIIKIRKALKDGLVERL